MLISIEDDFYNAWEEDIAVVNIFFGKGTVMGEKELIGEILPRAFYCTKMCEKSKSTTFSHRKIYVKSC